LGVWKVEKAGLVLPGDLELGLVDLLAVSAFPSCRVIFLLTLFYLLNFVENFKRMIVILHITEP
jgi:hypothetical protein